MGSWPRPIHLYRTKQHRGGSVAGLFDIHSWTITLDSKHVGDSTESWKDDPTFLHEQAHWVHQLSTPYGYYLNELANTQNQYVIQFCKEYLGHDERSIIRIPIYRWVRRQLAYHPSSFLYDLKKRFLDNWYHGEFLRQVLEGSHDCKSDLAVKSLSILARARRVATPSSGTRASPKLDAVGLVGGAQISECIASLVEFEVLRSRQWRAVGLQSMVSEFDSRLNSRQYMGLLKHIWDEVDFFTLDAMSLLVSLLCDLASFTPLHRIFSRIAAPGYAWEDLHPGYRLLKALECISLQMNFKSPDIEDAPLEVADSVCEACGWPTITEMCKLASETSFEAVDRSGSTFKAACALRLRNPLAILAPWKSRDAGEDFREFFTRYGPVVVIGNERFLPLKRRDLLWQDLLFGLYNELPRQLMLCPEIHLSVPEEIRGHVEPFSRVSPEQLIFGAIFNAPFDRVKPLEVKR